MAERHAMPPGVDWIPVDDLLARLKASMAPVTASKTISLTKAEGRILAKDLAARRPNPPAANSAVDGFGFAWPDGPLPTSLALVPGRAAAGQPFEGAVPGDRAIRILTGAALPDGVDTVVLEEEVTAGNDQITFDRPPKRGANVRAAGEDVTTGDRILPAGHRIAAPDLALMAATGCHSVPVRARLRVGVLSTGDELHPPWPDAPAQSTLDANRPMVSAVLARWGMEVVDLGIARDNKDSIASLLTEATRTCDAILTSGGASAGDEDHVSALLQQEGEVIAWRIAVKPGRPFAAGQISGTPVFVLPGNPVAAFVCALIFARPALSVLSGAGWVDPQGFDMPAAFTKSKRPGRVEFLRARVVDNRVEVFSSEGSGRISGLSWADGLVELPHGAADITPGSLVRYLPFASFGL